ncbi:MAG: glycerate 2-kinase [Desulforhopalus sp.]
MDAIMTGRLKRMREDAKDIFQAGLAAVAPGAAVKKFCTRQGSCFRVDGQEYDLDDFERVVVLGAGKAGAAMAKSVEDLLLDRIDEGLIVVKYGHLEPLEKIRIIEAGHPLPDVNGYSGAKAMLELAKTADEHTLIICLISGGGSALMPSPVSGVSLGDKQKTTELLLDCGADIHEINTIRKHLSELKGGGLARASFPATMVCLVLSDVVGDDLDSIASGPCVADSKTFSDCNRIIKQYALEDEIPLAVIEHLDQGARGLVEETPKEGSVIFDNIFTVVVGCNYEALQVSKEKAEELGYNTLLLSSLIEGETKDAAAFHMALAKEIVLHNEPVTRPACLISGGETTVTIEGQGKGGRNQEFVLATAMKMENMQNTVVLSAGTDGTDGPTDAAGAITDSTVLDRAEDAGLVPLQYLKNNDSYHFFDALGDLYKTGPTNTNVMDVRILLVDE